MDPNAAASAQAKGGSFRAPGLTRAATAPARPSIREAILSRKRSKANLKPQHSSADVADRPVSPLLPPPPPFSAPTGLQSAPVRRLKTRPGPEKLPLDSSAVPTAPANGRAASPALSASQSRVSPGRGSGTQTPPLSPPLARMARGVTSARAQSPLVGNSRKLTVLEQLNHADWKVRVEGIIVVACILAKRIPPNYEGQKMPTLPPSDVFAPTLAKLLNDPQPEVVENVVAPEVLAELAKVVPMEQIIPKVLLLSEGDDERHAHPINTSTMPALKKLLSDAEAADLLFQVTQSMNSSGAFTRKVSPVSLKPTEKRKITHGSLLWFNELVEKHAAGIPNEFFSDRSNYKLILNRFIQMLSTMKAPNLIALARQWPPPRQRGRLPVRQCNCAAMARRAGQEAAGDVLDQWRRADGWCGLLSARLRKPGAPWCDPRQRQLPRSAVRHGRPSGANGGVAAPRFGQLHVL